ncbi:MAG: trypsin-like peptidase domain-containing protein [Candidatus Aureabacteria bacterium]|nr:trypsin-like peptidase domain-containing protein [Candidatus Auribacterota bacterium]
MFANACGLARRFTRPLIISTRFYDGSVSSGCGAFVVVNHEGWIVTVAHLLQSHHAAQAHAREIEGFKKRNAEIDADDSLTPKEKDAKKTALSPNPKWITNSSFWWGCWNSTFLNDVRPLPEADLIVGRIEPFDPAWVSNYPMFKDPTRNFDQGTSLCRLGFPFHEIKTTFDAKKNSFVVDPACLPPPYFPIEGIFTRNLLAGKTKDGKHDIKFIETSSPGLRGQSGGAIFDSHGTVWGIQSTTRHLPLGFSPKIKRGNAEIEENQFLNVGKGIHAETILAFLKDNGISVQISVY